MHNVDFRVGESLDFDHQFWATFFNHVLQNPLGPLRGFSFITK